MFLFVRLSKTVMNIQINFNKTGPSGDPSLDLHAACAHNYNGKDSKVSFDGKDSKVSFDGKYSKVSSLIEIQNLFIFLKSLAQ